MKAYPKLISCKLSDIVEFAKGERCIVNVDKLPCGQVKNYVICHNENGLSAIVNKQHKPGGLVLKETPWHVTIQDRYGRLRRIKDFATKWEAVCFGVYAANENLETFEEELLARK